MVTSVVVGLLNILLRVIYFLIITFFLIIFTFSLRFPHRQEVRKISIAAANYSTNPIRKINFKSSKDTPTRL